MDFGIDFISIKLFLCLTVYASRKGVHTMKGLLFSDIQSRATEVLDLTSLTQEKFEMRWKPSQLKLCQHPDCGTK
jgi:hypothetical protein